MAKKENKREQIKESITEQLVMMGAFKEHYIDLIGDYMGFWDVKNKLLEDIETRGVTFFDLSSVGVKMQKNNPSVKELVMVNRQMMSILKELGLSTANAATNEEDEL